jgi:hypothetical protein
MQNTMIHTVPLFINNDALPFDELIDYHNLQFMRGLFYDFAPGAFRNTNRRSDEQEQVYNLRNNNTMLVPRFRIDLFKRFPLYYLPNEI